MRLRCLMAAAVLCGASAASAAEPLPDGTILAGSDKAVWMIRPGARGVRFDLATRRRAHAWRWMEQGISGRPAAAVASGGRLHLLFARPLGYIIFELATLEQATGLSPDDPLWPEGAAPLALCEAVDFGEVTGRSIVAVVPRPAREEPSLLAKRPTAATSPMSAATRTRVAVLDEADAAGPRPPGGVHVGVFQRIAGRWLPIADWRNLPRPRPGGVLAASVDGTLSVLVSPASGGPSRLAELARGRWRRCPLPASLAAARPLAMLVLRRRVTLVLAAPAQDKARRRLLLAAQDPADGTFRHDPIERAGEAVTWPADGLPLAARLGDMLALVWQEGEALREATCLPSTGQFSPFEGPRAFAPRAADDDGTELMNYFMWGVLIAVFVAVVLLRPRAGPRAGPRVFIMPEGAGPANLGKRLVAGIIDLAPFNLVAVFLMLISLPMEDWQGADEMVGRMFRQQQVPTRAAVASISMILLHTAYGTIMEARFGATLGKMLLRLRVIGTEGRRADLRECLLRNLMRIVELMVLPLALLLIVWPLLNRNRQRLGDMLARTAVVDAPSGLSGPTQPPQGPSEGDPDGGDPSEPPEQPS